MLKEGGVCSARVIDNDAPTATLQRSRQAGAARVLRQTGQPEMANGRVEKFLHGADARSQVTARYDEAVVEV